MNLVPARRIASLGALLLAILAPLASGLQPTGSDTPYPPTPAAADSIMVLVDAAHYAEAESLGWALLQELETTKGTSSFEVARVLDALAETQIHQKDRSQDSTTAALIERSLVIKRAELGPEHPEVARTLGIESKLMTDQGNLEGAIEVRKECLVILRKDPGPDRAVLASAAANTGILYAMLARYEEGTPYLVEALEVYSEAFGENHIETAATAHNVGNLYFVRGDYAEAQAYYERALAALEATLDPDHPRIMVSHYSLGSTIRIRGDYAAAREHYELGMKLAEQREGPDSPQLVRFLRGLSVIETDLGNQEEALALNERSLSISEAANGPESFEILADLTNLGISYRVLGRYEDSRAVLVRAIRIGTERSPEHDQLALPLAQLGLVEHAEGNHQAAVDTLLRALAINTKVMGPTHDQTGETHAFLATVYEDMEDYAASEMHLDAAIEAFGSGWRDQQYLARCLLQRSRVRLATERFAEAFEDAFLGEDNARAHYLATLRSLSERNALTFSAFRGDGIPLMVSLLILEGKPSGDAVSAVWDDLIQSRGLLLEEVSARHRLGRDLDDPELAELSGTILDARTRLATLYLQGPGGEELAHFIGRLDAISQEKEKAEANFAAISAGFRNDEQARAAGYEEVSQNLPEDGALIAFVLYPRHQPGTTPVMSYAVFVLSSRKDDPVLVDLGPADRIDQAVAAWRNALASGTAPSGPLAETAEQKVRENGASVREIVIDPLLSHLGDADPVLVVPAGVLHLINPGALPSGDDEYLVETGPAFHLLPAERAILPREKAGSGSHGLLALGGPEFDLTPVEPPAESPLVAASETNIPQRGAGPDCDQFLELEFPELPGAEAETREVADLWEKTQSGAKATALVGEDATETAFKQAAPGHSVLHLATHGYFLSSECALERDTEGGSETLFELVQGNPLLLSGLALSGSNQRGERPASEDGVLTAEEIATLDLEGVQWVVLSACDTGRGELREGAGVFGLQRAFQSAGARTVIMSLWEVDDQATRSWMNSLYRLRWQDETATAEAIRQASLAMLRERREAGLSTSPVTWGAFVATGDWR